MIAGTGSSALYLDSAAVARAAHSTLYSARLSNPAPPANLALHGRTVAASTPDTSRPITRCSSLFRRAGGRLILTQ